MVGYYRQQMMFLFAIWQTRLKINQFQETTIPSVWFVVFKNQQQKNKQQFALAKCIFGVTISSPAELQQQQSCCTLMKNKVVYLVLNPSLGYREFQRAFEITPRSLNPQFSNAILQLQLNQQMGNSCQFLEKFNTFTLTT